MDLGQIADNALNELEQADSAAAGTPPATPQEGDAPTDEPAADDINNDDTPAGGEDDGHVEEGEAEEENEPGTGDDKKEPPVEDEPSADEPAKGKQAQELTDDELLAELEKRGKKPTEPEKKEEEAKPQPRPLEVPEQVWGAMDEFRRTVYTNLPFVEARAKDGTVIQVKSDAQIPKDFDWDENSKNKFYGIDMPAQSVLAERIGGQLQGTAKQQQEQQQFQEEANAVVMGIEALVTQGIVPKIAAQPNTPEFNADPGVQRANQILTLRQTYLAKGENISIETAGRIFKAENPDLYKPVPTKSPADAERKAASRKIAGGNGRGTAGAAKKGGEAQPKSFPIGTSAEDIADYYADQLD